MNHKVFYLPLVSLSLCLTSCFSFGDNGEWKKKFGTPELMLENAKDEAYVYFDDDKKWFIDTDDEIKEAIKAVAPFESSNPRSIPQDIRYFTYEAMWTPATSGPNYEHLSIWENGFVQIDHKTSLGPHEYLYFTIAEAKAAPLVDLVFSRPFAEN